MDASRIDIEDKRSKLTKAFGKKPPQIGGNNLFTGEYGPKRSVILGQACNRRDWDSFWRDTLGQEPPGPLPKGAMAVMTAIHFPDVPLAYVPEKITRTKAAITVNWQRVHLATPENPGGKSRFAVLLIPKTYPIGLHRDVFPEDERRMQLADELKAFTEGARKEIAVLPVTKLRHKTEFPS